MVTEVIPAAKNAEFLAAGIIDRVGQPVRNEAGHTRVQMHSARLADALLDLALPDGSVVCAGTRGTEGSRGIVYGRNGGVSAWQA